MSENKTSNQHPPDDMKMFFRGWSHKESAFAVAGFVLLLSVLHYYVGAPENRLLALHPRSFTSIPAIFFSNFFHGNNLHLIGNLTAFIVLGFFVFNTEGLRGLLGIFAGMIGAGVAVWLFDDGNLRTIGFSGAVMACWGIVFVSLLRRDYRWLAVFLVLSYLLMGFALFETIRPTEYTESQHISWLGHLGGLLGGMASQIRSPFIALEILYNNKKVTDAEFMTIAARMLKNEEIPNSSSQSGENKPQIKVE